MVGVCPIPGAGVTDWQGLAIVGMFITFCAISAIYMLGQMFRNPNITAWSRLEIYQAIISAMIIVLISVSITAACSTNIGDMMSFSGLTFPASAKVLPSDTYFDAATKELVAMRNLNYVFYDMVRADVGEQEKQATRSEYKCIILCGIFQGGYSIQPGAGLYSRIGALTMAMSSLQLSLFTVLFQLWVLKYLEIGALLILLPLGTFFRSMPFLRGFGSALIAITIGLFLLYPFLIVLNGLMIGNFFGLSYTALKSTSNTAYTYAAVFFIANVFLPALNFLVIIIFTRQLSAMLGQEVDISRLAQMV
ncbi:Uncharacterised protein [Candidatus Gugararchaeum adminiculabundum]|nr:Uncharacterised protein [Candidatus Gugararchaeum adminiculabundum]